MEKWLFGLDAWVIQDGNYPDFTRGQKAEFAIEFEPQGPIFSSPGPASSALDDVRWTTHESRSSVGLAGNGAWTVGTGPVYELVGSVAYRDADTWVLDFGISAYCSESPPAWMTKDAFVTLRGALAVDHFTYFESLARLEHYPELIYAWHLDRIGKQTAPWVEEAEGYSVRDEAQSAYYEIQETDAWADDGGHAEYVLECTLLETAPTRRSSTAAYYESSPVERDSGCGT
jgi:hypothetical protein